MRAGDTKRPLKKRLKIAFYSYLFTPFHRVCLTPFNLRKNGGKAIRHLEIGPGAKRVEDFETLNVVGGRHVDYVTDATRNLPFPDDSFDIVYASHVLEHIPWYESRNVLEEWTRILKPGGRLEIWLPDGELICEVILDLSHGKDNPAYRDGWKMLNPEGDPFLWANGRLFYGANNAYPSWHKAIFTETSLKALFETVGLQDVHRVDESVYRGGANHGPINLGIWGTKP